MCVCVYSFEVFLVCSCEVYFVCMIHNIIVLEVWKILSIHIKFYFTFMKNEMGKERKEAKKRVINLGNIEKEYGHFFPFSFNNKGKISMKKKASVGKSRK